ncbi:endonuclease V isoform X6 [Oryctolagus cuniculus]|uniref:endonuclease V isoform X6 n=1 Tax=Oryctolagus cuniculus TaxID=9986 RepID=UPI00387A7CB5
MARRVASGPEACVCGRTGPRVHATKVPAPRRHDNEEGGACAGAPEVTFPEGRPGPSHGPEGGGAAPGRNPAALETVVYEESRMVRLTAPYVSGFLAFREAPFLVDAVQRLREKQPDLMPQVLLVDGNGVLHHQGFGVACHLGVLTDLPCIGVAKKLLQVDGLEKDAAHKEQIQLLQAGGEAFPLIGGSGTVLGMALRSHDRSTKPVYVSVGHKVSLETAVRLTRHCCRFRVPEPVRQADIRSREHIRRTLGPPGMPAPAQGRKP